MHKSSSLQMCVSVSVPSNANPQISQNSDWTLNKILLTESVSRVDSYFFGHIFFCKLQTLLQTCMVLFSMLSNISYHSCFIQLFLFRSSTFCSYFVIVLPVRMWSVNDILHLWVFEYFFPFFHCFSPWITKMGGESLKCNEFKNDSDDDNKECEPINTEGPEVFIHN